MNDIGTPFKCLCKASNHASSNNSNFSQQEETIEVPSWDKWFMKQVYLISERSKDPSSKVGAIIVDNFNQIVKIGYNGFPSKVNDKNEERWKKPLKLLLVAHAEANAIFFAARTGTKTENCKLYTSGIPCCECAKAIIQSGINSVFYHKQYQDKWNEYMTSDWERHEEITKTMFNESGIELTPLNMILNIRTIIRGNVIFL